MYSRLTNLSLIKNYISILLIWIVLSCNVKNSSKQSCPSSDVVALSFMITMDIHNYVHSLELIDKDIQKIIDFVDTIGIVGNRLIEYSGGIDIETNEIINPCAKRESSFTIIEVYDINNLALELKGIVQNMNNSLVEKTLKDRLIYLLDYYFLSDNKVFQKDYFDSKVNSKLAQELFIAQGEFYMIVLEIEKSSTLTQRHAKADTEAL